MQFKNIVAFVSLAITASALPAENIVARTTPGQTYQNQCSATQTAKCCNSVTKTLINLQLLPIGQGCTDLDCEPRLEMVSLIHIWGDGYTDSSDSGLRPSHWLSMLPEPEDCMLQFRRPGTCDSQALARFALNM